MKKAGLPASIRVGPFNFKVEDWLPSQATARNSLAECDKDNLIIRLRTDLHPQQLAESLLHEVAHAIYYVGKLETGDGEERTVSVFSVLLLQVVRDNPKFMHWLVENSL